MRSEQEIRDKIKWLDTEIELESGKAEYVKAGVLINVMGALYWTLEEKMPNKRDYLTGESS